MRGYDRAAAAAQQRDRRARVKASREGQRELADLRAEAPHLRAALEGVARAATLTDAQTIATAALEPLPGALPRARRTK